MAGHFHDCSFIWIPGAANRPLEALEPLRERGHFPKEMPCRHVGSSTLTPALSSHTHGCLKNILKPVNIELCSCDQSE